MGRECWKCMWLAVEDRDDDGETLGWCPWDLGWWRISEHPACENWEMDPSVCECYWAELLGTDYRWWIWQHQRYDDTNAYGVFASTSDTPHMPERWAAVGPFQDRKSARERCIALRRGQRGPEGDS